MLTRRLMGLSIVVVTTGSLLLGAAIAAGASAEVAPAASDDDRQVVLIGVPGLTWDDVTPETTPALSAMVAGGAPSAALSMFATINSCDADGWLTVATGLPTTARDRDTCIPTEPEADGRGATMSRWSEVRAVQERSAFHPELGRLTMDLATHEVCIDALGPGSAATAADASGFVARYHSTPADAARSNSCLVRIIDGVIGPAGQLGDADRLIARVTSALPEGSTALIFSVPDQANPVRAMGVAVEYRQGSMPVDPTYLTSATTRWPGVVSLIDVAPTVFALLGVEERTSWAGAPWSTAAAPPDITSVPGTLAAIGDRDNALRSVTWFFLGSAMLLSLIVWVIGEVAVRSRRKGARLAARITRSTRVAAWLVAIPLASILVGAVPWWFASRPVVALYGSALLLTVLLGELLSWVSRRWGTLNAALLASLGLSALILGDVVLGGSITRGSPLAPSPLSGGRFYGLSNATSASLAVAAVWAAVLVGATLLTRRSRRTGLVFFGSYSAVVVLITALPTMGADVGGALTLLPTFALTGAYLFAVRVTVWRATVAVGVCVLVPLVIALVDYTRPPEQWTHLGRFVDLAVSGEAWDLLSRKAGYATASLMSLMSLVTLCTLAVIAYQLYRLLRHRPLDPSWTMLAQNRAIGAAVLGSWIAMVTGSAVNDYGMRMATIGLILLVPLLLLTLRGPDTPGGPTIDDARRLSNLDPGGQVSVTDESSVQP